MSESTPAPAIVMRAVARTVNAPNGDRAELLRGVDLEVPDGALLNIVGPSGSGKSTLLRLVSRMDEPTSGSVAVLGRPLDDWPPRELRRTVAMVFQESTLLDRDVRGNLLLPFELVGSPPDDFDDRAAEALRLVGLDDAVLDRGESQVSVGQKQRIALARALLTDPRVLLLDEPTGALDVRSAEALLEQIVELQSQRSLTVMIVTHRLAEARQIDGLTAVLIDGRVAAVEPTETLFADPPSGAVRDFLAGRHDAS